MKPQRTHPAQKPESEDLAVLQNKYLIGWPGYRNARNRSGLGYVETQAEWAQMQGRIFRMLLERKVITRNPIFLIGIFIVGTIYSLPVVLGILEILAGNTGIWMVLIISLPAGIFGILLLNNVFISLFRRSNEADDTREDEE